MPPRSRASFLFTNTQTSSSPVNSIVDVLFASYLNQEWASLVKLKLCYGAPGSVGKVESA